MSFKEFLEKRVGYFSSHFAKQAVLMDFNGEHLQSIDLSFHSLSELYLSHEKDEQDMNSNLSLNEDCDLSSLKISDTDLQPFWSTLNHNYQHEFNVEGQDIGDQSILKLSELYQNQTCKFKKLKLGGNFRISVIGITKLGQVLQKFNFIEQINLHFLLIAPSGINRIIELAAVSPLVSLDLGLIGNDSLQYLTQILANAHQLQYLAFTEDINHKWSEKTKKDFQNCIRKSEWCRQILAINVQSQNLASHYEMISELNILCQKNRSLRIEERENDFKAASLNPSHSKYYDPDNHSLNAYKFSVKSYLNNVFGSLLDEALYFLEKERRNSLREDAIFNITKQPINKIILEDICTADGSIIVLTKYLLGKIKQNQAAKN